MANINSKTIKNVRDLIVYQTAFDAAMEIYRLTKAFPSEEKYSLTDQIRRSSRSVCSNLSEGWHKRQYIAAFVSKVADSMQEASETQTWLDFSLALGYVTPKEYDELFGKYETIISQLITMKQKAVTFCPKK